MIHSLHSVECIFAILYIDRFRLKWRVKYGILRYIVGFE